jgi:hypothetical protein
MPPALHGALRTPPDRPLRDGLADSEETRCARTRAPSRTTDVSAPPAELTVREATAPDIEGCVALAELVSDGSNVDWSELFRHNLEHNDRHLVVAQAGDELIGYGRTAWFEPDPAAPPNAAPAGYYLIGPRRRPKLAPSRCR